MKIKSQRDFFSGLMFLVVGVAFAWGATEYSFGTSARPGPGYFPFGLGVLLALLGGFVLFKALTLESESGDPIGSIAWRPLVVLVITVAAFGLTLPRLGLVLSLGILIAMTLLADRGGRFAVSIVGALMGLGLSALLLIYIVPFAMSALALVAPAFMGALTGTLGSLGVEEATLRSVVNVTFALLGRVLPFALVVYLLVTRTPLAVRKYVEVIVLVAILICLSRWMFIDGLGLTMPVWPIAFAN